MKRWTVAVRCDEPFIDTTVSDVVSETREHAAQIARASRRWPQGTTFRPRPADAGHYTVTGCWLDSRAGELYRESEALA